MIYLDNAATTKVHPNVAAVMLSYLTAEFGNPSSVHGAGRSGRQAIEHARTTLASFIGASPSEIVFTSGGTEAIHAALFGTWLARATERKHIVTSAIEHHAVLDTVSFLASQGAEVSIVQPDIDGIVHAADVLAALRADTLCVAIMSVNNETGAVQPVDQIGSAVKAADAKIIVMSDMIQRLGSKRITLQGCAVDLATFSAHKVHGPKGVGALFVRRGTPWQAVLRGGSQERGRRAGTENVAGIAGFGAAVADLSANWDARMTHLQLLKQTFLDHVRSIEGLRLHSPLDAVPTIVNVGFAGVRNDTLLMRLDLAGVMASAGSACTAGSLEPSHVLAACGIAAPELSEALRFSFSDDTSVDDVVAAADVLRSLVAKLRKLK